eukprot:Amastigsp_a848049_15.p4 type:complete len:127 gc:universal Amastigsp_a848049_15:714-1094(+)
MAWPACDSRAASSGRGTGITGLFGLKSSKLSNVLIPKTIGEPHASAVRHASRFVGTSRAPETRTASFASAYASSEGRSLTFSSSYGHAASEQTPKRLSPSIARLMHEPSSATSGSSASSSSSARAL